jgi:hypothetical protein
MSNNGLKICCWNIISCLFKDVLIKKGYVGLLYENGSYIKVLYPGKHSYNIWIYTIKIISLNTNSIYISPKKLITKDRKNITIDAIVLFDITDVKLAIISVDNYIEKLTNLSTTILGNIIKDNDSIDLLKKRLIINNKINSLIEHSSKNWGINNVNISILNVDISILDLPFRVNTNNYLQDYVDSNKNLKISISCDNNIDPISNISSVDFDNISIEILRDRPESLYFNSLRENCDINIVSELKI